MRVGFTGTREGLTAAQREQLANYVVAHSPSQAHHGCCVGADEVFSNMCGTFMHTEVIGHPGDMPALTMANLEVHCDEVLPAKPNLDRNRDIVDACEVLFACPKTMEEEQRSGTWATVRYARKVGRRVVIFWPDGTVT